VAQLRNQGWRRVSKTIIVFTGFVLFCSISLGLWDLFHDASLVVATVALMFVAVGAFNTWTAFNRRS
jgi:hypothetical protein